MSILHFFPNVNRMGGVIRLSFPK